MMRARDFASLCMLALLLAAAACTSGADEVRDCTPGKSSACTCDDGRPGAQSCASDGKRFEPCVCSGSGGGGGVSGGGGFPSGGAGGASGDGGASASGGSAGSAGSGTGASGGTTSTGGTGGGGTPGVYTQADCIQSANNGSEICDDEAWQVVAPGKPMVLACINDNGGVTYVATNTGPKMSDGVERCQGWETNGQNPWDHLQYIEKITCDAVQKTIDVDLSAYVGQVIYIGTHDHPAGGGHNTPSCLSWKK